MNYLPRNGSDCTTGRNHRTNNSIRANSRILNRILYIWLTDKVIVPANMINGINTTTNSINGFFTETRNPIMNS